jgi:hypothetical protein
LQNSANPIEPVNTRSEVAKIADVSHDTVAKVKAIHAGGTPELVQAARAGNVSISAAAEVATLPQAEQ